MTIPTTPIAPNTFIAHLSRLVKQRRAAEAASFFGRHGPSVLDRLSEAQRLHLDEIMEYVDTVTGFDVTARGTGATVTVRAGAPTGAVTREPQVPVTSGGTS